MRQTLPLVLLLLSIAAIGFGDKKPTTLLTVRAVTHTSRVNEYTSTYTTPGTSNTNCGGSATTIPNGIGSNTTFGANCQTTSTPAQVHQNTRRTVDVTDIVEANGKAYTISCRANWAGSNCAPMIDGDEFPAEIDGETMWITAHKGGNQGKEIRTKYRILDIRAVPDDIKSAAIDSSPKPTRSYFANADVVQLKGGGLSDPVIIDAINSAATVRFELDTSHLIELHNAGLSDAVIQAMLGRSKQQ